MLTNLLQADIEGFLLLLPVLLLLADIILGRDPDHRLQRLGDLIILHFLKSQDNRPELHASRRLNDDLIAGLDIIFPR